MPRVDTLAKRKVAGQILVVLLLVSVALWWHSLGATFKLAAGDEASTHILIIIPVSVALIYLARGTLPATSQPRSLAGAAVLLLALLTSAAAKWGTGVPEAFRLSLSMFSLVVWWLGSILFCLGEAVLRSLLFPLCFLFWVVPIPGPILNWIIVWLQQQSAIAARLFFQIAMVPVSQDGILLFIPGLDIEVARECSSIRSSILLVIITLVLAYLFLRSWGRRSLLVAAAVPLSAIKNGLRIFVIAELGTRVDPGFLTGRLHHQGGIIFLGIAVGCIVALLWLLRRCESSLRRLQGAG
jgi:exosortase